MRCFGIPLPDVQGTMGDRYRPPLLAHGVVTPHCCALRHRFCGSSKFPQGRPDHTAVAWLTAIACAMSVSQLEIVVHT